MARTGRNFLNARVNLSMYEEWSCPCNKNMFFCTLSKHRQIESKCIITSGVVLDTFPLHIDRVAYCWCHLNTHTHKLFPGYWVEEIAVCNISQPLGYPNWNLVLCYRWSFRLHLTCIQARVRVRLCVCACCRWVYCASIFVLCIDFF